MPVLCKISTSFSFFTFSSFHTSNKFIWHIFLLQTYTQKGFCVTFTSTRTYLPWKSLVYEVVNAAASVKLWPNRWRWIHMASSSVCLKIPHSRIISTQHPFDKRTAHNQCWCGFYVGNLSAGTSESKTNIREFTFVTTSTQHAQSPTLRLRAVSIGRFSLHRPYYRAMLDNVSCAKLPVQ